MSAQPHVVILGAGPAGVGAAFRLVRDGKARVTVLERNSAPGGNAGSFDFHGLRVDYGSHRLHRAVSPRVLADLEELLGPDLLARPRRGRIRLQQRWIRFPLKPADLALRLPPRFALGTGWDAVSKPFRSEPTEDNFAAALEHGLGRTLCRDFYFPYARKSTLR